MKKNFFERFSSAATHFTGTSYAFIGACLIILIWAGCGPVFDYSETWQLIVNTGTTIITFLMVFLIQKSQNKDSKAIQIKLNELLASSKASNRMLNVEDLTEKELDILHAYFSKLYGLAKEESDLHISHSVDEATKLHHLKMKKIEP